MDGGFPVGTVFMLYGCALFALSIRAAAVRHELARGGGARVPYGNALVNSIAAAGAIYAALALLMLYVAWFGNEACGASAVIALVTLFVPVLLWVWFFRAFSSKRSGTAEISVPPIWPTALASLLGGVIGTFAAFATAFGGC